MPLPDDPLCFLVHAGSRILTNAYRPGLAKLGLTYPQFNTLLALWECDEQGVAELAQRLHLDTSTLSPLVKRMEVMHLVERNRSTEDERRVTVRLTPEGRALSGPALDVRKEVAAKLMLSKDEYDTLTRLMHKVIGSYI